MVPGFLKHNSVYGFCKAFYLSLKEAKRKMEFERACKAEYDFLKTHNGGQERFKLEWNERSLCDDRSISTGFDVHYVYHLAWAIRILKKTNPAKHVDIASYIYFPTMLSAYVPVEFYDIRPAHVMLDNLQSLKGDLMSLPFDNNSVHSLSCMHVIEHPGLGRYGDPLDYNADLKAMKELQRVLAIGGTFLFVVPIGKSKIQFNANRIFSYAQIIAYFNELQLVSFSLIPDNAMEVGMIADASESICDAQAYGCGCFWFTKK